ncbi:hypothetical protein BBI01_07115 [Chryseobacterium artocarpi]|uniref:Uncharacterized protein n=1 Tax=Chryseobacterium artocarpi TaxID=1414727 RepID=A0A1B8ZXY3_9FLAO|nr:hypothetical protein [Chryseobacterium artocarpi]OCA76446.1 hypothetical protein BBI01_07115 [Chryseobacterium artocarpi]
MPKKYTECSLHGKQEIGLLCTHLAHSLLDRMPVGFHEFDPGDLGRPDAFCDLCHDAEQQIETEKDEEEWFTSCDYKILCVACWDEAKELNRKIS